MVVRSQTTPDRRRYNAPTADENGILIFGNDGDKNAGMRDIVLRNRSDGLERISDMHRFYDVPHHGLLSTPKVSSLL